MPIIEALQHIPYTHHDCMTAVRMNTLPKFATEEVPVCPRFQLLSEAAALVGLSGGEDEIAKYLMIVPFCGVTLIQGSQEHLVYAPITFCDYLRRVYLAVNEIFSQRREFIVRRFDYEFDDEGNLKIIPPPMGMDTDKIPLFLRNVADVLEFQQLFEDADMADFAPEDIEEKLKEFGDRIASECFGFGLLTDTVDYKATKERLEGDETKSSHYVFQFSAFNQWQAGKGHYRTAGDKHCQQMPFRMAGLRR
ncbi:MAG: hypothetical protein Athens101428_625 [Candidatus Berkelbacteria bacterium Athens1014_28]|uniref:Uncharacterized protein n=1 Tax=Candidatus Berkelbacteria bacterium Athens1014_28 TaxID=2017145 RepID=A0A554LL93_9BACT|nr:MAG: hypothetical protein Athens101428_625 [Candidatus Berkelbacteria bacterium Athens1014_28]